MIEGIDVSHFQDVIDFKAVTKSGRKFAFLKCTEGESYVDSKFSVNRKLAIANGLNVGAYHFYHYDQDWGKQATNFVTKVGSIKVGELPPVLDLEQDDFRNGKINLSKEDAARKVIAWLNTIQDKLGVKPIIYCDRDFASNFLTQEEFGQFPLWLAAYGETMPRSQRPWTKLTFWQYNEHGKCPGVYGDCDLNRFVGSNDAYNALIKK